jgi:hypothetical protein
MICAAADGVEAGFGSALSCAATGAAVISRASSKILIAAVAITG